MPKGLAAGALDPPIGLGLPKVVEAGVWLKALDDFDAPLKKELDPLAVANPLPLENLPKGLSVLASVFAELNPLWLANELKPEIGFDPAFAKGLDEELPADANELDCAVAPKLLFPNAGLAADCKEGAPMVPGLPNVDAVLLPRVGVWPNPVVPKVLVLDCEVLVKPVLVHEDLVSPPIGVGLLNVPPAPKSEDANDEP